MVAALVLQAIIHLQKKNYKQCSAVLESALSTDFEVTIILLLFNYYYYCCCCFIIGSALSIIFTSERTTRIFI